MKPDIHPVLHDINLTIGKDNFLTRSTSSMKNLLVDVDFRQHPAWNKSNINVINQSVKSVSDFNRKFTGINFGRK